MGKDKYENEELLKYGFPVYIINKKGRYMVSCFRSLFCSCLFKIIRRRNYN